MTAELITMYCQNMMPRYTLFPLNLNGSRDMRMKSAFAYITEAVSNTAAPRSSLRVCVIPPSKSISEMLYSANAALHRARAR